MTSSYVKVTDVVLYVGKLLRKTGSSWQSITITRREKFELCSVDTVIIESSDDIETRTFYVAWQTI